jgi:K+-sensing histidine kinase KdpD
LLFAAIESSEMDAEVVMNCESGSEWIRFGINAGGDEISAKRLSGHFRPSDGPEQEASAVDGMGLGLLLARRLVELMGGTFGEERNSGGGKAFLFDLRRTLVPVLETLDVDFGPSTANAIKG